MRLRYVAAVGFVLAGGLFVAGAQTTPPTDTAHTGTPYYLLWAAIATAGLTFAAAVLTQTVETRPRSRPAVARGLLGVIYVLVLFALGEAALYVAERPSTMDARLAAQTSAFQLFVGGVLGISVAALGVLIAINRRERRTAL